MFVLEREKIIQKENDIMKKPILFKRTRKSVIRENYRNPYIRENLEYFGCMFSILEICYMLFHLKEINNMFQDQK